jgi:hypothetical protein
MSTILDNVEGTETGYNKRIHVKGASEYVLGTCTDYIDEAGNKVPLDDTMR